MTEQGTVRLPEGSDPFWEGLLEGQLILPQCGGCGKVHFYPRRACPFCSSRDLQWTECMAEGDIYSVTTYRRGAKPKLIAYVEVTDGVRLLTLLDGPEGWEPRIGDRVKLMRSPAGSEPMRIVFGPHLI